MTSNFISGFFSSQLVTHTMTYGLNGTPKIRLLLFLMLIVVSLATHYNWVWWFASSTLWDLDILGFLGLLSGSFEILHAEFSRHLSRVTFG